MSGTLLLADDSITIQKVVELTFASSDLDVVSVNSGRELLQRVKDINPDIVLCDVVMPEVDGYEVCQQLKSEPATLHIPVVLLTGTFEPFDRDRALAAGCDAIVTKPFEAKELVRIVEDLLHTGRTEAAGDVSDADSSGIPEGVPALDFTTTGFDRMVPEPAEEPLPPEEGLEVTSIGDGPQTGAEPLDAGESAEAEADLPWGQEVPDAGAAPHEDETFPSPPRPAQETGDEFPQPPSWDRAATAEVDEQEASSPWATGAPARQESPWDTSPPGAHGFEGPAEGDDAEVLPDSPQEPPFAADTGSSQPVSQESVPPRVGGRPLGAPPVLEETPLEEIEMSEDEDRPEGAVQQTSPEQPAEDAAVSPDTSPAPTVPPDRGPLPSPEAPGFSDPGAEPEDDAAREEVQAEAVEEQTPPTVDREEPAVPTTVLRELTDEDVDRIARRVLELAQPMLERISWEVIPDMAEMLVHQRIRELEAAVEEEN